MDGMLTGTLGSKGATVERLSATFKKKKPTSPKAATLDDTKERSQLANQAQINVRKC